jgi:hypothetical protein
MNNCLHCGTETTNPKYCCRSCSAKHTNVKFPKKKLTRTCSKCSSVVKSYKHSLCEFHHEELKQTKYEVTKNLTLQDYWNKKSLDGLHTSSKNAHIRQLGRTKFKDLLRKPCANCGYSKHVELCHIKPIRDFKPTDKVDLVNARDNVIQLCPNCHWEFDNGYLKLLRQLL